MAETEERIRILEQRLAQAEARIVALEAAQRIPSGFGLVGSPIFNPNTAAAPMPDRGFGVSATSDGYVVGRYGPGEP